VGSLEWVQKSQCSGIVVSWCHQKVSVEKYVKHKSESLLSLSQCKKISFNLKVRGRAPSMTHYNTSPVIQSHRYLRRDWFYMI
jgi:hypothetical protein